MPDDKVFDFDLNELASETETAAMEELRKQIARSAGNILSMTKKLAENGDINALRRIESALNGALSPRTRERDEEPDNGGNRPPRRAQQDRTTRRETPPPAPAAPAEPEDEPKLPLRRKLVQRLNQ